MASLFPEDAALAAHEEADDDTQRDSIAGDGGVAVITAARRPSSSNDDFSRTPKELLKVGGETVIWHSLRALVRARIDNVIVLVGYRGDEIAAEVSRFRGPLDIEIVSLGEDWRGTHAQSIMRAEPALERLCGEQLGPALLMTSDHLFDPSLLDAVLRRGGGDEMDALLVEGELHNTLKDHLLPKTAVRVRTSLEEDELFWCERVGRRVDDHDAFDAGLVGLGRNTMVFEALERLAKRGKYFALCDALDAAARKKKLRAIFTDGRPWVAVETEEQYETTRVLLASPAFRDRIPIQVHYKSDKGSSDSLFLDTVANEESLLSERRNSMMSRKYSIVSDDEDQRAIMTTTIPFADDNDDGNSLFLVQDGDRLLALVPQDESMQALLRKSGQEGCELALAATAGLQDANDLERVGFEVVAAREDEETHVEILVERRVPIVGWVILAFATALQASGALIFAGASKSGIDLEASTFWRPMAASICVLPLVLIRRMLNYKQETPPKVGVADIATPLAFGSIAFFCGNTAYLAAFALTSSPNNVVLLGALTPVFVVLARAVGIFGSKPSRGEVLGTTISLLGALLCGVCSPSSGEGGAGQQQLGGDREIFAMVLCIFSVCCHAGYSMANKSCRSVIAGPDLHLFRNFSSAAINLALQFTLEPARTRKYFFSMDPQHGTFGFLSPSRLGSYIYCGLAVDTGGTMGYVVALAYFDPLVATIAALFQPLSAALESTLWNGTPLPSLAYFAGAAVLVAGALIVMKSEAHTTKHINADAAIVQPPAAEPQFNDENLTVAARDRLRGLWRRAKHHGATGLDHGNGESTSLI